MLRSQLPNVSFALIAVGATFISSSARAQFVVNNTHLPAANIKKANPPAGKEATLRMNIVDLSGEVPILKTGTPKDDSFTLFLGNVGFRHHAFSLNLPAGEDEYFPEHLYAVNATLVLAQSLTENWYAIGFGSAGLHSDFNAVDFDHFVFEGGGFAVYKITDGWHAGLGPVFTYAFGQPLLIPAPYLRYQGDSRLSLEVNFPRLAKVTYAFSDRFDLGLAFRSLYSHYRLGDKRARTDDGKSSVIVFSDAIGAVEASVGIVGPLFVTLGAGYTLRREFTVNDDAGNELFDRGMKNNFMFSAGLETRL